MTRNKSCRHQMRSLLMTMNVGDEFALDDFVFNITIMPPPRSNRPRVQQPRMRVATLLCAYVNHGMLERVEVKSGTTSFYRVIRPIDMVI